MNNTDNIKKKIQALLNKNIENGATEAEAIAALTKATELMQQYYITENDLKEHFEVEKCELREIPKYKTAYKIDFWYNALSNLFDCQNYYTKTKVCFFGYKDDLDLCEYFYHVITRTAFKEAELFKKSNKYQMLKQYRSGRMLVSSFVKGFMAGIGDKMFEMYQNRKSTIPYEKSLVLVEKAAKVEKEFNDTFNFKTVKSKITGVAEAFKQGVERGEQVELNRAIGNAQPTGQRQLMFQN